MSRQYFEDLPNEPLNIANAAVSFLTAELPLFPNASQIAIPAADVRPGKIWRLTAGGIMTLAAASGTLIITPGWGQTLANRVALGVSATQTVAQATAASAWWLNALLMCRAIGLAGANSTFIAQGVFQAGGVLATAGSSINIPFGGTQSAICDPAIATGGGFYIGMTFSVTGTTMTPQIVALQSLN
jgi:hypothetical protein